MLNKGVGILGVGSSIPEKILTNSDLEKMVETSDEWILKRTGISQRHILDENAPAYMLGVEAANKALKDAGISAEEIDLIIVATETPDYLTPSTSSIIQKNIGAVKAAVFDLNAACSGFVYALTVAHQFIKTAYYKYVLVIGCEGLSKVVDWNDRKTCVLFGDAAAAAVLGPVESGFGIITTHIGADGRLGHNITIPCCYCSEEDAEKRQNGVKRVLWMDGSEVFKFAVKIMDQATRKVVEDASLTIDDIKLIIPHQANIRIIDGAAKRLGLPEDRVFANVKNYGNVSSASIPLALGEAIKKNRIQRGDNIILVGFGGGLTWASALIK